MNLVSAMPRSARWSAFSVAGYRCRYSRRRDDPRHGSDGVGAQVGLGAVGARTVGRDRHRHVAWVHAEDAEVRRLADQCLGGPVVGPLAQRGRELA